ncbi:MAG TPA: serine/threonine protein kinase [Acidiferrobacteraceae bacterium]|nr:serine/threonine protein kinase [Acidiferrobacteraceae bacterium]
MTLFVCSKEQDPPYNRLTPDRILAAVEQLGLECDARLLALNSYENRVYQVGIEDAKPVIVKFYRPHRWTDQAIIEEHQFAQELAEHEIPVVAPWQDPSQQTLHHYEGFRYAVFPRQGGHWPDLESAENLKRLGRFIGRIHRVGASKPFAHRPTLSREDFGSASIEFLLDSGFIPPELHHPYASLAQDLMTQINQAYDRAGDSNTIRLHGDCHPGNILWTDDGAHFVDFDDCRTGPAIQDLWMLLSGERQDMTQQLNHVLEGYEQFHPFDARELNLIEALRTLRIIHYAAWLARRWDDPAFPKAFPWFNAQRYWEEHILSLREQAALLSEAPLSYDA